MAPAAYAVGFLLAATALFCSAPGVVGGDAPELASAVFHLGPAHAPGYPLYVALGHLFQLLPVGTPAFRLTLFSIIVQCWSFFLLAGILEKLPVKSKTHPLAGFLVATLVFAGPLLFHQMVSPEVFSLHLLMVTLLLKVLLTPNQSNLYLGAFCAGTALAHHHLILLVFPALVWTYRDYLRRPKILLSASALFVIGLTPYLILPIRAAQSPLVNWGNPSTWSQFIYHLTRAQYGGDISGNPLQYGLQDLGLYLKSFAWETFGVGILLALAALWKSRRELKAGYYLGLFFLFVLLPFLIRTPDEPQGNFLAQAFLPPALLWLSPLMLLGFGWILERAGNLRVTGMGLLALVAAALLTFSTIQNDASRNLVVEDVGRNILSQLPRNSVLFSEGDAITFPLAYLKLVCGLRPEVTVFDRTGGLFEDLYHLLDYRKDPAFSPPNLLETENKYVAAHHPTAVYYTESSTVPGIPLTMTGLLFQVLRGASPLLEEKSLWSKFREPRVGEGNDYLSRETGARYFLFMAGYHLEDKNEAAGTANLRQAKRLAYDNNRVLLNAGIVENIHGWYDQASLTFEQASLINPYDPMGWFDRGVVLEAQKQGSAAISLFQKAVDINPRYLEAHEHLGYQYYQTGKIVESIREWEAVKNLAPDSPEPYRNLGYLQMQTQPVYAAQMFRRYLTLSPNASDRLTVEQFLTSQRY